MRDDIIRLLNEVVDHAWTYLATIGRMHRRMLSFHNIT